MDYRVLGVLEARRHGHRLPVPRGRASVLLGVLLLRANTTVSTDELIAELWSDRPPERAANALQVYASRLRKLLVTSASSVHPLVAEPPGYRLRAGADEIDRARFRRLLTAGRRALAEGAQALAAAQLRQALAMWRGPLLAGLESPTIRTERAVLEHERRLALAARIDADLACGRHDELIGELKGLAAGAPLEEDWCRQLMLALERSGGRREALAAYGRLEHALAEALGVDPPRALRELRDTISRGPAASSTSRAVQPERHTRRRPARAVELQPGLPFVGRAELLLALEDSARQAIHETMVVTVEGAAGSGKSAVLTELVRRLPEGSRPVWAIAFSNAIDMPDAMVAEAALTPSRVALVDDAHWIDPLSGARLRALLDDQQPSRLLVLAHEEPRGIAAASLLRFLEEAGRTGPLRRLPLLPLHPFDLLPVVACTDTATALLRHTAGHPATLARVVAQWLDRGIVHWRAGALALTGSAAPPPPPRQRPVDGMTRRLVELVTVAGRPLPVGTLASALDLSVADVHAAGRRAVDAGLLQARDGAMAASVVAAIQPGPLRAAQHALALASRLAAQGEGARDPGFVGELFLRGGRPLAALPQFVEAAHRLLSASPVEALQHADAAVVAWTRGCPARPVPAELRELETAALAALARHGP